MWFRKNIQELDPYVPGIQPRETGFIKLNTNENPYPPSPRVTEALAKIDPAAWRLYPDPHSDSLRRAIARVYDLKMDNVIIGNGSDELLSIALRCFTGERDRVIFSSPTYSLFDVLSRIQGAEVVRIELNDDFSLPESFFASQGSLKFLASPNSPTGTLYPLEVIDRLLEQTEGVVVVDEAYVDFAEESALPLVRKYPHLLITRTFSKAFGLAGLRIGYAFAAEELISGMMKVKDSYNLNQVSARAAEAAVSDQDYFRRTVSKIKSERDYLREQLEELSFFVYPSGANFLLCRPPFDTAREIYEKLLERKILIRYFDLPRLRDYLRISVGTHTQMEALVRALREIQSESNRASSTATVNLKC